jgi:hypothetical protein
LPIANPGNKVEAAMVPAALYKKVLRFIMSPCYVSIGHKEYIPSDIPYLNIYKTIFSPFDANDFTKFNP